MDEASKIAESILDLLTVAGAARVAALSPSLSTRIRAYGEQCRRAGAEAMCEAAAQAADNAFSGDIPTWAEIDALEAAKRAVKALPLPSAAEAASPAAGWRLVPVEPTEAMTGRPGSAAATRRRNTWKAMLEVAPSPPNTEDARGG